MRSLEFHHSRPQYIREGLLRHFDYNPMSWNAWQNQWGYQPQWKYRPAKKDKDTKKIDGPVVMGYDGSKVSLGASSQASSSKRGREPVSDGEGINELKAMFVEVMQKTGNTGHPLLQKLQEEDDRDQLRKDQKELNQRRKAQKRIDNLKKQINAKEKSFAEWKKGMKQALKSEEERFQQEVKNMKADLEKALKGEDDDEDMPSDISSEDEADRLRQEKNAIEQQLKMADSKYRELQADNQEMHRKMNLILSGLTQQQIEYVEPKISIPEVITPPQGAAGWPIYSQDQKPRWRPGESKGGRFESRASRGLEGCSSRAQSRKGNPTGLSRVGSEPCGGVGMMPVPFLGHAKIESPVSAWMHLEWLPFNAACEKPEWLRVPALADVWHRQRYDQYGAPSRVKIDFCLASPIFVEEANSSWMYLPEQLPLPMCIESNPNFNGDIDMLRTEGQSTSPHFLQDELLMAADVGYLRLSNLLHFGLRWLPCSYQLRHFGQRMLTWMWTDTFVRLFLGIVVAPLCAVLLFLLWYLIWGRKGPKLKSLCIVRKRRFSRCSFRAMRCKREINSAVKKRNMLFFLILLQLPTQSDAVIRRGPSRTFDDSLKKPPVMDIGNTIFPTPQRFGFNASFGGWSTSTLPDALYVPQVKDFHDYCDFVEVASTPFSTLCTVPYWEIGNELGGVGGIWGPCDSRCIPPWIDDYQNFLDRWLSTTWYFDLQKLSFPFFDKTYSPILEKPLLWQGYGFGPTGDTFLGRFDNCRPFAGGEFQFCDVQTLQQEQALSSGNFDKRLEWICCVAPEVQQAFHSFEGQNKKHHSLQQDLACEAPTYAGEISVVADATFLMQRPPGALHRTCGTHVDPRIFWDRLSIRHMNLASHAILWLVHPNFAGSFQTIPYRILWDGISCIRCVACRLITWVDPRFSKGPYLVRPQPPSPTHAADVHWILLRGVQQVHQRVILLQVNLQQHWIQGALVLNTHFGTTTVPAIFDHAKPHHLCRTTSWCRVRWAAQSIWWPDAFQIDDYVFLEIDEIPSISSVSASSAAHPTTNVAIQSACAGVQPDPGSTDYTNEGDEHALLTYRLWAENSEGIVLLQMVSTVSLTILATAHSSGLLPNHSLHDFETEDDELGLSESWPDFELSHGLERVQPWDTVRIHRPNPMAVGRPMSAFFYGTLTPVPYDVFATVFSSWPELAAESMRWPTWKLKPVHASYYSSSIPDIATQEFVLTSESDNTVLDFCRPHMKAVLLHLEITTGGSAQQILKCMRVPPSCTAVQLLECDQTNTAFFHFQSQQVWHNGDFWPLADLHELSHGDYIFATLKVNSWGGERISNVGGRNERSRSPLRSNSLLFHGEAEAPLEQILLLSPRQSDPGETTHQTRILRSDLIIHVRRAMRQHWPSLGLDSQWAPLRVPDAFRISPFLSQYAALFLLLQHEHIPACTRQALVALEVIQIFARVARGSELKAKVIHEQVTGLKLLLSADTYHECFNVPMVQCTITVNAREVRHHQVVHLRHGDFAQVLVRHSEMHSSYQILASISDRRAQVLRDANLMSLLDTSTQERAAPRPPNDVTSRDRLMPGIAIVLLCLILISQRGFILTFLISASWQLEGAQATGEQITFWRGFNMHLLDDIAYDNGVITIVDDVPLRQTCQPISIFDALDQPGDNMSRAAPEDETPQPLHSLEVPLTAEDLAAFKYAWHGVPLDFALPLPSSEFLPETISFLLESPFDFSASYTDFDAVHIYVDGSFFPDLNVAAWSFSAVGVTSDGLQWWLGWTGDRLVCNDEDPAWTGASKPDGYEAELTALFYAGWWALDLPPHLQKIFFFDNTAAGFFAAGRWSTTLRGPLPVAVRSIHQLLSIQNLWDNQPLYQHVKSHQGDPMNELVDIVAKYLARAGGTPRCFADIRSYLQGDNFPLIGQFPLLWQLHSENIAFPQVDDRLVSWDKRKLGDFRIPSFVSGQKSVQTEQSKQIELVLSLASYNVSTLDPSQGIFSARAEYLREQMAWRSIDVVALQETRCRDQVFSEAPNYFRFLSPAEKGKGGCEIWFSRTTRCAGNLLWAKQNFTVIHFSPELLVIAVASRVGHLTFVSGHAPHSATTESVRNHWWKLLHAELRRLPQKTCIFLLGDLNAQFGEAQEGYVGTLLDEESNGNGRAAMTILENHDLWIPATFEGIHTGPSYTWKSAKCPAGRRLDYIGISRKLTSSSVSCWVDFSLDAGQVHEDHFAVLLKATFHFSSLSHEEMSRKQIDRDAIRDPHNIETIAAIFSDVCEIPWGKDVHTHYDHLTETLFDRLIEKFPQQRKRPRRTYISDASWHLWHCKSKIRKRMHFFRKQQDLHYKRAFFDFWSCKAAQGAFNPGYFWKVMAQCTSSLQKIHLDLRRSLATDMDVLPNCDRWELELSPRRKG